MLKQDLAVFVCLYSSFPTITPAPWYFPAVHREAWLTARSLGERRGEGAMCPGGNASTLFLSDLFASLGQSLTGVTLKFFLRSEE